MIWNRRKKASRPRHDRLNRAIESLEPRCMLTVLAGGDLYRFQQSPGVYVQIQLSGSITAEFVGAVVDDVNEVILTDLPGRFINSATGRAGADILGGLGGRDGIIKAGPANARTTVTMNNGGVLTQNAHLNMENLAAAPDGSLWTINRAVVNVNGQNVTYSQVVELDPVTGAGTEQSSIGSATLDDLAAVVAANSFNDTIGDMAVDPAEFVIDPLTGLPVLDPISGLPVANPTYGFIYALTRQGWLYTVDRDLGTVTQIGRLTNQKGTPLVLADDVVLDGSTATLEAMTFDAAGNLFVMTRDYDDAYNPANDATDASDQLINNQPLPVPPPAAGTVFPNKSAWDVAMLEVDKTTAFFTDGGTHLVTDSATSFELTNHYTALIWSEADGYFYAAAQEIDTTGTGGGGGGTGNPPWELHRWIMPALGTGAPVVAENRGDIVTAGAGGGGGGGAGANNEVHGFAYTQDLWNNDILVGIEHTTVNNARVGRLITLDPNAPGSATAITPAGAVRLTRGIGSYQVPGEIRPTIYTVAGGTGTAGGVYRGSAVSLGVDDNGVSNVQSILASDFNPLNGMLYFVVDQTLQDNAGQYLMVIDVNATNRTAIQNSMQVIPGRFDANNPWQISSITFDQTSAFTVDLLAYGERGNGKILNVPLGNTDGVTADSDENTPLAFDCDTPFTGNITGISLLGDDPNIFGGDDPDAAQEFVYATVNGGANSYMIRIRRHNPGHTNGSATAMMWGMLPDPDDPPANGVRGQDIRGLTWNATLTNPFTFEPGALMGTDVTTDELVYVDHRMRSPIVNIFNITTAQSAADAWMYISEYVPVNANALETIGPQGIIPFTGDTGTFSVVNIPGPDPFVNVTPNPNTGRFLLGLKTRNVDCNFDWEALRPILPDAPGYELVAPTNGAFGMIPDGNGWMKQGFFVRPAGLVSTVANYTGQMVGQNIDLVSAASVRNDGLIALIDSDHINELVQAVPDRGDQLAIIQPGNTLAGFIIDVTEAATGAHLGPVNGLDWGDPDGDGIEDLFAIFAMNPGAVPTLGTIDITNGVFTAIAPIVGITEVTGLAFSPDQHLYVADGAGGLHEVDPATGNYVRWVADVPPVGSMDFALSGLLYIHDTAAGRLVSVDVATGQVGTQVATADNSLRTSIGAISYNPQTQQFIGFDNGMSREIIGDGTAGTWSTEGNYQDSSMLVYIPSAINEAVIPQDIGAVRFGGTVMGQVDISGSIEDFYAGWLPLGASGGQYLTAPQVPQNFRAGGEIRDVLVLDSIGTHDASAYRGSIYSTGFDALAGGRIQEIVSREDVMGSVRAVNNGTFLPNARFQQELESRPVGMFGNPSYNVFWNDDSLRPQYVGTVNSTAGNNVVQVVGTLLGPTIPHTDLVDRYSVSLMAGQTVVVKLTPLSPLTNCYVGVFDPDARLIATDYSDIDAVQYHYQRFTFTADRPGVYEFAVGGAIPNPDFSSDISSFGPYELLISASNDGVTASGPGNIAVGAVMATGNVFDGRATGNPWRADAGDFGAMVARTRVASMTATAGQLELVALADPMQAIANPSIRVDAGSLRAVDGGSIGIHSLNPATFDLGVDIQAINGSVGLIRSVGTGANDATVVNDDLLIFGTPAVSDHDIPGLHRDAAVGMDYQMVSAENRFYGALMADRSIGTVRSRIHDYLAGGLPVLPGWFVVNADRAGDDGIIGMISSEGDIGNPLSGGPAVITGPGGDLKYMYSGGVAYRDLYFGSGVPEQTLTYPGESPTFNDDSGAVVRISPQSATDQMLITTYPVRGSGGVAVVEVIAPGNVQIGGTAFGGAAGVQIGNLRVAGQIIQIDGTAPVDVFNITGGAYQRVVNSTDGEFVNITAGSIGRLEAGYVGVPRKIAGVEPAHIVVRTNAFPFAQQRVSINSGTIDYVHATHAVGNLNVTGNINLIYADADRQRVAGEYHGIVAPVVATGDIVDVTIGEGISSSGSGNLAHSGIYANGRIGIVRGDNADIRGNIISQTGIDRVQLTNGGSIVNANIEVITDRTASREWMAGLSPNAPDPVNLPNYDEIGAIMVSGPEASRQIVGGQMATVPAYNGGIIGSLFIGADMGDVDVVRGYGIINSAFGLTAGDGRMKDFNVDGYGIRDVALSLGAAMGRLRATGRGELLQPTDYSATVRQWQYGNEFIRQYSQFDNASRFAPNRTTDLTQYLYGVPLDPTENTFNAGVIAGTTVKASRTMDELEAWQVRPSTRLGFYNVSDFDIGSSIKLFTTISDVFDMEVTTGGITRMTIGGSLISPSITVAGIFSDLRIGLDYVGDKGVFDHNIIEAIGNNGEMANITVGRNVDGMIFAQRRIGNVRVLGQFINGGSIWERNVQVAP